LYYKKGAIQKVGFCFLGHPKLVPGGCIKSALNHPGLVKNSATPPEPGGENIDFQCFNFLLLIQEEYPDPSVRGRW